MNVVVLKNTEVDNSISDNINVPLLKAIFKKIVNIMVKHFTKEKKSKYKTSAVISSITNYYLFI